MPLLDDSTGKFQKRKECRARLVPTVTRFTLGLLCFGAVVFVASILSTPDQRRPIILTTVNETIRACAILPGSSSRPKLLNRTVRFVTFASNEDDCGYRRLKSSAATQGIFLENGWSMGQRWKAKLRGGARIEAAKAFFHSLPRDQLVLTLDGYDTLFAAPVEAVLRGYDQALADARALGYYGGSNVVLGAESNYHFKRDAFPSARREQLSIEVFEKYPMSPSRHNFVQAGTQMGPAGELAKMLDDATDLYSKGSEIPWSGMSDQTMLHRFIAEQQQFAPMNSDVCTKRGSGVPCLPHIDYCQRLFLVALNPGGDVQLVPTAPPADPTKSQMLSTTTGSSPAIFHAPGPVCKNAQQNMSCPLAFLQEWQPEPIIDCLHATRKQRIR